MVGDFFMLSASGCEFLLERMDLLFELGDTKALIGLVLLGLGELENVSVVAGVVRGAPAEEIAAIPVIVLLDHTEDLFVALKLALDVPVLSGFFFGV